MNYLEELAGTIPDIDLDVLFAAACEGRSGSSTDPYFLLYERNGKDGSRYECRGDSSCRFDPGGKSEH